MQWETGLSLEWCYCGCRWNMSKPKFMWKDGSKWLNNGQGFWASLIVYNTANGIGSVEQKVGSSWCELSTFHHMHAYRNLGLLDTPNTRKSLPPLKTFGIFRVHQGTCLVYGCQGHRKQDFYHEVVCRREVNRMGHLGNMWLMNQPEDYRNPQGGKKITVRVKDMNGRSYGEFTIPFTCGDQACYVSRDANPY